MRNDFFSGCRALWLLAVLAAGCATAKPSAGRSKADGAAPDYRIGPEDVLEVEVWGNDALRRKVPVRPDGMISLPLLNDVGAAGLTPRELRSVVAAKLSQFIPNPEVSVIVQEVHAKVAVLGEVLHAGRYELRAPTTALDILAQAGGPTAFASTSKIVVLRGRDDGREPSRIFVDMHDAVTNGGANPTLQPGDIVFVP